MQMHLFLGRIVLHDSNQNHDVIVKSVNSQMMSNEKNLDTYSVDSFRYDPSFKVIAKIWFILIAYTEMIMSDFQLYLPSTYENKRSSKLR